MIFITKISLDEVVYCTNVTEFVDRHILNVVTLLCHLHSVYLTTSSVIDADTATLAESVIYTSVSRNRLAGSTHGTDTVGGAENMVPDLQEL